jgi:hypothetical protein
MAIPSNRLVCPECGAVVTIGDKFCRGCGVPFEMPTHDDAAISEWKGTEKSSRVSVESNAKHQTSDTSNSNMFWIILLLVVALTGGLVYASGQATKNTSAQDVAESNAPPNQGDPYDAQMYPFIQTGEAWATFVAQSGIRANGSISDFASNLSSYLDGVFAVSKSSLQTGMNPGNGLYTFLHAIINNDGVIDLVYTWMYDHAPN